MSERALLESAFAAFHERFGRPASVFASAPGRVNLIGEHTDYNEGFVLPIAINRHVVIAARVSQGGRGTIRANDVNEEIEIDWSRPIVRSDCRWANYLLGVAAQLQVMNVQLPQMDMLVTSTVPIGAGLSSSAAIEVATASLLEIAAGCTMTPVQKARLCQKAEHTFAGTPCGIMDMLVSAAGVAGSALLIDCRTNRFAPVPLPPVDRFTVLIVDTKTRHELASSEYAQRRAACEAAADELGLPSLRDATLAMLEEKGLSEMARRRASHVITENTRTLLAAQALQAGELETFGDLLFASHDSLRDLYAVSCPELDTIVEAAMALRGEGGVIGARMTGGGFGGCAIVVTSLASADSVTRHIATAFESAHQVAPDVFAIEAVAGARAQAL